MTMTSQYVTEAQLRGQIVETFRAKRRLPDGQIDAARLEADLASPSYARWVEARLTEARNARRLLTSQQMDDLKQDRTLRLGDRARYIGPQRLELSPVTGRHVLRKSGQTGVISAVTKDRGMVVFTFVPDVDEDLRTLAESQDVEVLALVTSTWVDLERIP